MFNNLHLPTCSPMNVVIANDIQINIFLGMSTNSIYVYCLLWRAGHNKLIANPCLPGK